jgi:hypothetical protein
LTRTSIPSNCILNNYEKFGIRGDKQIWRSIENKQLYTWDSFHSEVEVYNLRGKHLGAIDPITGRFIKKPVKGRHIDV